MTMFPQRIRKIIALFLLLNFITSVIAPSVAYALTAGPTAPEATSFEPVDTTSMVNLPTGDFVYNLPLLEVPGPAGGYPLSLSYHAGIMPNEEASWVGLGFTLNPGAITRTVNGYPDDHFGALRTRQDYNEGGKTNTFTVGIGYPGVSYGLAVSHDTNRGLGIGGSLGIGAQVGGFSIGASFGTGPFGGTSSSVGIGLGNAGVAINSQGDVSADVGLTTRLSESLMTRIGLSTNFNGEVGMSASFYSMGSEMSTKGVRSPGMIGGFSINQVNSNASNWDTRSGGFSVPIPIGTSGLFLNLGYNYFRYHLNQSSRVSVIGSLHANKTGSADPESWSFDSYALINTDSEKSLKDQNPDRSTGGSFPSYDVYQVNAQGLNGTMQPYILDNGSLFRQNLKEGDRYALKFDKVKGFSAPVHFRFKNDFANSYTYNNAEMLVRGEEVFFHNELAPPPAEGYNENTKELAGSKHIEWYTNYQIANGEARATGFIDYQNGSTRKLIFQDQNIGEQIGGYSITNESGVTYHYALPAYVYDEFSKSFVKGKATEIFQNNHNQAPYAYMWLLTAITGSDYVDRNENGLADETDWGYWVTFDYGLWADDYKWRNPVTDYHSDLDQDIQFYSRGKKEIYYLDAIKTKTHVAVFEKAVRKDGKGLVDFDLNPSFERRSEGRVDYHPTDMLRLKNIYLLQAKEYLMLGGDDLRTSGAQADLCNRTKNLGSGRTFRCQVFDEADDLDGILKRAVRVISFEHSNDLQPGTINSFSLSPSSPEGKLTLDAVSFRGKGGSDMMPPIRFEYGSNNPSFNKDAYDLWGFYKSDYKQSGFANMDRMVSDESAQKVDAWSLTKIITSLGASIDISYESDTYVQPSLSKIFQFTVSSLGRINDEEVKIGLFKRQAEMQSVIKPDVQMNMIGMRSYANTFVESTTDPDCEGAHLLQPSTQRDFDVFESNLTVARVNDDDDEIFIYVHDRELAERFEKKPDLINPFGRAIIRYECEDEQLKDFPNSCIKRVQWDSNRDGEIDSEDAYRDETYTGVEVTCQVDQKVIYAVPEILAGNVAIVSASEGEVEYKGGGLRVTEITVTSAVNNKRITKYSYQNGTTTYEPSSLNQVTYLNETTIPQEQKSEYAYLLNKRFSDLLQIAREVPAPGVIYKYVTLQEEVVNDGTRFLLPNKIVYEFEVFDDDFVERMGMKKVKEESSAGDPTECFDSNGRRVPCKPEECFDEDGNYVPCPPPPPPLITYSPLTINDFSVWGGSLKSTRVYGPQDRLLEQTVNHYLHDGKTLQKFQEELKDKFNNQGAITQIFNEVRSWEHNFGTQYFRVLSKKTEYPLIPTSVSYDNFKTGISSSSENVAFDFFSGVPIKVVTNDSYGNHFMTETIPAYRIPEYSGMTEDQTENAFPGMGLKVNNHANRNMISQVGATYVYQVNEGHSPTGLISASIQTWDDRIKVLNVGEQPGIWRKHQAFIWDGDEALNVDGTYDFEHYRMYPFNWKDEGANTYWLKTSEVSLYDHYSHGLEAIDINGNKASSRMDPGQERVIASASNAGYHEMAFSGAEYYEGNTLAEGGVHRGEGNASPAHAHTGNHSLLVAFGSKGFNYNLTEGKADLSKKYRASVWLYAPGEAETQEELNKIQLYYTVDGVEKAYVSPLLQKNKSKSWYLLNLDIDPSNGKEVLIGTRNNSSRGVYLDDFRIHPLGGSLTGFVYDSFSGELAYILDANNFYTKFEYDAIGRLIRTSKELLNYDFGDGKESFRADAVLKEVKYNYGQNH